MAKEIRRADMVYTHEFAKVMGVSIPTIRKWVLLGYLDDVRKVNTSGGVLFHIYDIFKYAHPNASKDALERMIFDYRMAKSKAKNAKQTAKLRLKKMQNKRGVK